MFVGNNFPDMVNCMNYTKFQKSEKSHGTEKKW
jgi:hypothetical protein